MRGQLYVGTSGFAYPGWAPRFYPHGLRGEDLLAEYCRRLNACELNNTFYQSPTAAKIGAWLRSTPEAFRFAVKAQRGGSVRALLVDPVGSVAWLTGPYREFGARLGTVLFRIPEPVRRDDERLRALLDAWPPDLPITLEFQHPSWHDDEVIGLLRDAGAVLCATDLDGTDPPNIRLTGTFLYLRLRRTAYTDRDLGAWADRVRPFLDDGRDVFVFLRHDQDGQNALLATRLPNLVRRVTSTTGS